jgi:8-oxo-dGTP pyrophosphatase MutT (NUDIX family)
MKIIVDEADKLIRYGSSHEIGPDEYIRGACLWIRNMRGEALLALRASGVSTHRNMWGPAVTGATEEGEGDGSYVKTAAREAMEELGLENINPEFRRTYLQVDPPRLFGLLLLESSGIDLAALVLNEVEVAEVAWVPEANIARDLGQSQGQKQYTPLVGVCLDVFAGE